MSPGLHTLTGAYAIDALSDLERRRFEPHLTECPDCAQEVHELRATAARLAMASAQEPPGELRRRILAEISRTRQEPPGPPSTVHPGGHRSRTRWPTRITAAAAAIALLATVALGVITQRTQQRLEATQAQLAQTQARYAPIDAVLQAPDARSSTAGGLGAGSATLVASHQLNRAVLIATGMPKPPPGHDYQVWLVGAGAPRSAGLLPTAEQTRPLVITGLTEATKIAVTVEPAGGSALPTTLPLMALTLPT